MDGQRKKWLETRDRSLCIGMDTAFSLLMCILQLILDINISLWSREDY